MDNNFDEKLSISTSVFEKERNNSDLSYFLEIIQQAGFKYIEISCKHINIGQRVKIVEQSGLKIWSIHGTLDDDSICNDKIKRHKAVQKEISRMNNMAMFAPCPYVVHYLNRSKDPACGKGFRHCIEELYAYSSQLGFNLSVETAPYKPEHNERYPDSREIADFVRSFKRSDLSITIDVNHSNLNENILKACDNCNGLISNVHLSDNWGHREEHLVPGEGTLDFAAVLCSLRRNGYNGIWNLEFRLRENPDILILQRIRKNFIAFLMTLAGEKQPNKENHKKGGMQTCLYRK